MGLLSGIGKRFRSFRRYNQIIRVFVKYGFEELVSQMIESGSMRFLRRLIPKTTRKRAQLYTKWEKMRLICEELGPTFVKFGQILSNRPDILPMELILEFEKLQDKVPPFPGTIAAKVVEDELNKFIDVLFAKFEREPFASASMAQVHEAQLITGEKVAVKIQRPKIKEIIIEDIKVMYTLAAIFEKRFPAIRAFDPIGLVKHFEISILKELDFIHESVNIQQFYYNLKNDKSDEGSVCPVVYQELTTSKVLTMEYIEGIKISNLDELKTVGLDRKKIAKKLAVSYIKQVFEYGFFHADLHPGNIVILKNGELGFLDFGLMGSIMKGDIIIFGRLFVAVKDKDIKKIIHSLQELAGDYRVKNMHDLEYAINDFVNKYSAISIHTNEMSTILLELKDIVVEFGLKVPSHFFLLARSMVTVEGVIRKLDPELSLMELARPFMKRAIRRNLNPILWAKRIFNLFYEIGVNMEDFPREMKSAIRSINSGQISVNLNHQGIDPLVHTFNRVAKQIVSAVLATGFLIGSILLIIYEVGPSWKGYSAFGVIGFIIGSFIALGMVRDILRGNKKSWEDWKEK